MADDFPPHETTFGPENAPSDPSPDAFVGAFALLAKVDEQTRYATVRTETGLDLIRAVRGEAGSYRDSLLEEVGRRLDLDPKRDIVASGVPRAHLNSRLCGKGSGEPRWYICEFFMVHLFGRNWPDKLDDRDDLVWLSGGELMDGGRPNLRLADDVTQLLRIADAIPPDER